ncbi:hypothetical protein ACIQW5_10480 [Methylorubrum thiocyanatum]|uniref:hypothetical protein n=1 Tax=Methylorubrum thiocyanatum TaxID=47958 RepID=UPI00383B2C8D
MFTKLFRWVYPEAPPSTPLYDSRDIRSDLARGVNPLEELVTPGNATTASASVTADTVSTSSDEQLAAMMISVLDENSDIFAPISRDPGKGLRRGMFAVISKLRAEGVIR